MIDIRIDQQFGNIGLEINKARYDLKIKPPDITVAQAPAEISLERTDPDLIIDYSPMLESLGYGGPDFLKRFLVKQASEEYLVNLERIVQEGNAIGAIEKDISIGEAAAESAAPKEKELELVPLFPINITYIPGTLKYEAKLGGISLDVEYGKVSVENFVFPSVKVFLEQKPYLKIKAVGQAVDYRK